MATTSSRLLRLLSLLGARARWPGQELADRLEVSTRTLRRDVDSLRDLGYPVHALKGPDGGYRLGAGSTLPPLLLDAEQAIAVAVALQTAPTSVAGIDDGAARALTSLTQVLPPHLRAQVEALHMTRIRNAWEFPVPPIASSALTAAGRAVSNSHLLRFDVLTPDGHRPEPGDPDFVPPLCVEPHHLVMWAGRWYVVGHDGTDPGWHVYRLDRIHLHDPTGIPFARRELPTTDVAGYVMTSHDRGDTPAPWQCVGTALLSLPPEVVARWAPGGSVVEHVTPTRTRITLGAWSWAGIAGLLATFDADLTVVGPPDLEVACRRLAERFHRAGAPGSPTAERPHERHPGR